MTSSTNAVLHPWLQEQLSVVLTETLPPEEERPLYARWETWLGHPPDRPLPPLRILLVLDNLAGHLSSDLVRWFAGSWSDAALYTDWEFLAQYG